MTAVMKGIRVLEVAEHTFVPQAAALLADWGAEVIKIEPVERGDASRGMTTVGSGDVNLLFQTSNRGKRSLALDLSTDEGRDILYKLAAQADVFMTNKLPGSRRRLKIEVEDLRAHNPNIIYVRGGGAGERGPEADRGSYDLLSYWHRSGASQSVAGPNGPPFLPAPGFGDSTGAMFIAGGTMGALFHRERTGEAPVVDASLLATGMWAMNSSISAAIDNPDWPWPPPSANPLSQLYTTKDGSQIALGCLQAGYYWPLFMRAVGREDLVADPRFSDHQTILANHQAAVAVVAEEFARYTLDEWYGLLADFPGQWTVARTVRQVPADPQVAPNGYLQPCQTASGSPFQLVAAPIQYDGQPAPTSRAPEFNEHGDTILEEIGLDWDAIVDLKVKGVVG